jgi:citrate lyase subunit beta/citryl-CoA lyase
MPRIYAFAQQPDAGIIGPDGAMLDLPHVKQVRRALGRAG